MLFRLLAVPTAPAPSGAGGKAYRAKAVPTPVRILPTRSQNLAAHNPLWVGGKDGWYEKDDPAGRSGRYSLHPIGAGHAATAVRPGDRGRRYSGAGGRPDRLWAGRGSPGA